MSKPSKTQRGVLRAMANGGVLAFDSLVKQAWVDCQYWYAGERFSVPIRLATFVALERECWIDPVDLDNPVRPWRWQISDKGRDAIS